MMTQDNFMFDILATFFYEFVLFPALLLIVCIASLYAVRLCYKQRQSTPFKIGLLLLTAVVLTISAFQFYSYYNYLTASIKGNIGVKDVEKDLNAYYVKAAEASPFVNFKSKMYEKAATYYETMNSKNSFDKKRLYHYQSMTAKYNSKKYTALLLSSMLYEDLEVAVPAGLKAGDYYRLAIVFFMKQDFMSAFYYANKFVISKGKRARYDAYLLRGLIAKNLGNNVLAKSDIEKAYEKCTTTRCEIEIERAIENSKTYYLDKVREARDLHVKTYGY